MKNKPEIKNLAASLFLQFVTIISGFVIPKIILSYFGSEANGLVSSITQFLSYITILEGGVGSVIMAALYKPLFDRDESKISAVVNAALDFFRKIALVYVVYVVAVAFVYPVFVKSAFSYGYVVCLAFVLAINLFVQYFFSISYRLLLTADRKVYIVNFLQGIIVLLNMAAVVVCTWLFNDILLLKLASAAVFCIIPFVYHHYVAKHYNIDTSIKPDSRTLSQRWDGFGINLAFFMHSNTGIVILTIFSTLENISVFAVYLMIVNALKGLTVSVSSALTPSFGKVIAEGDVHKANRVFDLYQTGMYMVTSVLFSCGIVLVTPFVDIYTANITDANYHQPAFGAILMAAEMIYCLRDPLIAVAYTSGNFKAISKYAYTEAAINIVISLILVNRFGLIGIAVGTASAMLYRTVMQAVFASRAVLFRPFRKFVKEMLVYGITILVICLLGWNLLCPPCSTYAGWIINAIKVAGCAAILTMISSMIFFPERVRSIIGKIKR